MRERWISAIMHPRIGNYPAGLGTLRVIQTNFRNALPQISTPKLGAMNLKLINLMKGGESS